LTIVNDILDFSKIESGKLELESHPFELHTCIEEALDLLAPKAAEKKLDLAYIVDDAIPRILVSDVTRLRQILVNLIGNAVKFSPAGARVTAGLTRRGGFCVFAIEDDGPGIAPEDLAMLFQRYGRVESANVLRLEPGVGLGLVFVDAVARRHGGRVAVDSKPGKGSRFELWIPVEASVEGA
jgi:signal transduction histidine kinase